MQIDGCVVAGVQTKPVIGDTVGNLSMVKHWLAEASALGSLLAVFPECALTGYCFSSIDEARNVALSIPVPETDLLQRACHDLRITVVVGTLEKEGDALYNSAIILAPSGIIGVYRKAHLPFLGVDRFASRGNQPFHPYATPAGKTGVLICYDLRFPEPARILSLRGATVIALPSNWPVGGEVHPDFIVRSRACENHIYLIAVNRCGNELGTQFIGRSQIVDPNGQILIEASAQDEQIITASIDLKYAGNKHIVIKPGEFEMHLTNDRRPELYGDLCSTHSRKVKKCR